MVLYHGTSVSSAEHIKKRGILLGKCKDYTDFGKGFYTSKSEKFAIDTAVNKCLKSKARGVDIVPAVVVFEFDESALSILNNYIFEDNNIKWLQFIINNRNGLSYTNSIYDNFHNLDSSYEIVQGGIADGRIVEYADECRLYKRKASSSFLQSFVYKDEFEAHQTSFHTENALKFLHYVEFKEVTDYE